MVSFKELGERGHAAGWLGKIPKNETLAIFVERVRSGRDIAPELLHFIADGIERYLDNPDVNPWPVTTSKGGRPIKKAPSDSELRKAAEVQFYRRMLPKLNRCSPLKQSALAARFDVSERTIRSLEAVRYDEIGAFSKRIWELIRENELADVIYLAGNLWYLDSFESFPEVVDMLRSMEKKKRQTTS